MLRGIVVDSIGIIYTAVTSCHCLGKITPDGKVKTILKIEHSWTPTEVVMHNRDIDVMEYTNANGPATEGWFPRVRKLGRMERLQLLQTFPQTN